MKAQSVWVLAPISGLVRWYSTDLRFNQCPLIHLSRNRACPQPLSIHPKPISKLVLDPEWVVESYQLCDLHLSFICEMFMYGEISVKHGV